MTGWVLPTGAVSLSSKRKLRPLPIATVEKALIERWGVERE